MAVEVVEVLTASRTLTLTTGYEVHDVITWNMAFAVTFSILSSPRLQINHVVIIDPVESKSTVYN